MRQPRLRHRDIFKLAGITPRRQRLSRSVITSFTVTTAKLRRALHSKQTPRAARTRIYNMLLNRRHR